VAKKRAATIILPKIESKAKMKGWLKKSVAKIMKRVRVEFDDNQLTYYSSKGVLLGSINFDLYEVEIKETTAGFTITVGTGSNIFIFAVKDVRIRQEWINFLET